MCVCKCIHVDMDVLHCIAACRIIISSFISVLSLLFSLLPLLTPSLLLPLPLCTARNSAQDCLVSVTKVLLNLTHDNELGSCRLGEQAGLLGAVLEIVFKVGKFMSLPYYGPSCVVMARHVCSNGLSCV